MTPVYVCVTLGQFIKGINPGSGGILRHYTQGHLRTGSPNLEDVVLR